MNAYTAYTPIGEARIEQRDISASLRTNRFTAAAHLAALERQRGWQADAELEWLLMRDGRASHPVAPSISGLRQTIGAALIRVGQRLAGPSGDGLSPETVLVVETYGMTG